MDLSVRRRLPHPSLEQVVSLLHRFFHHYELMTMSGSIVSEHRANDARTLSEPQFY
jgi:hypothetical protein